MERGLMWLPLLGLFIGLAWAGWNEYQKLEAYQLWSKDFERHKYDILAALGQKEQTLTWGKPTRKGLINQRTIHLEQVQRLRLKVDQRFIEQLDDAAPTARQISLELVLNSGEIGVIPFTDVEIACKWYQFLEKFIAQYHQQNDSSQTVT
ncbi:MAG: hypothetical protein WCO45_08590 [Pseudanabaena sp. ELA607]|jgi:hypothetical protein